MDEQALAAYPPGVDAGVIDSRFANAVKRAAREARASGRPVSIRKYSWLPVSIVR